MASADFLPFVITADIEYYYRFIGILYKMINHNWNGGISLSLVVLNVPKNTAVAY